MNDTTTAIARMKATIPSANVERVVFWIMRPAARVLKSDGEANRDQLHNDPRCSKYGTSTARTKGCASVREVSHRHGDGREPCRYVAVLCLGKHFGAPKPVSIARCEEHFPRDRRYKYHARALPIGYPDTAVVCAMPGCDQPALVWLTPNELNAFANGERMFDITPRGLKLRVTDEPPTVVAPDIVNRLSSDDPAAQAVGR